MNKSLRKLWKNARALSPVVASIILIAVTVAVSVAVAAWMGGMTIGFMGTSSMTVTSVTFDDVPDPDIITLDMKNTGTKTITVASVKVNNVAVAMTPPTLTIEAGADGSLDLSHTDGLTNLWVNGNTYKIDLFDSNNQVVGSTQQNAPGA